MVCVSCYEWCSDNDNANGGSDGDNSDNSGSDGWWW